MGVGDQRSGGPLLGKLSLHQLPVSRRARKKFRVSPCGHDLPMAKDEHDIRVLNRGKPMGDNDSRSAPGEI